MSTSVAPALAAPNLVVTARPALAILTFSGQDAASFLQGQLSSDVAALADHTLQWSSYNSPKGRMLATLCLWREGPQEFRALVASDLAESIRKRLTQFVMRAKVTIADLSGTVLVLGVGGAGAAAAVEAAIGVAPQPGQVALTPPTTVLHLPDGRFVLATDAERAATLLETLGGAASAAADEAWHLLAIRAGVPIITAATQDLFVPQSANWELVGGVNFQKGCYPGQEIVARMQYLGRLKERLGRFRSAASATTPRAGLPVFSIAFGDQPCGTVVNVAAVAEGGSELLAVVQLAAMAEPPLHLATPDGPALEPLDLPYALPAANAVTRPKL